MPSTLKLIGKSSEQSKQIYKSLVAKRCPSALMPVKHPKSTKQVADKKRYEGEKRSVSHDDLYGAYEIAHTLTNFVLDFKLFSELLHNIWHTTTNAAGKKAILE